MATVKCACGQKFTYDPDADSPVTCPVCRRLWSRGADAGGSVPPGVFVSLWLLLGLVAVLVPAWAGTGNSYRADLIGSMASAWLPVALALLLSIRAGGLNLSVWGMAAMGAATAWWAIAAGVPVPVAAVLALAAGAAAGWIQAEVVRRFGVSSLLVSLVGGIALLTLSRWAVAVVSPEPLTSEALGGFNSLDVRLLISALLFSVPMLALLLVDRSDKWREQAAGAPQRVMAAALIGGGALSAGGGVLLLLGQGQYQCTAYLLGDLRVLAAVALCGAWVWQLRGGTLLAGVLLPPALLVLTIWRERLWLGPGAVSELSWVILLIMTLGVQGVARRGGRHGIRRLAGWLAWAGVMIIAAGAFWLHPSAADALPYVGAAVWLAGVLAGTVGWGGRSAR